MTYEQAKAYLPTEVAALHPAASGNRSKEAELLSLYGVPAVQSKAPKDGCNKLERAFRDEVLEPAYVRGAIREWWREPIKLGLGGRTYYSPDFLAIEGAGEHGLAPALTFCELKGFMREDANVKIKVSADKYPCFRWLLIYRDGRRGWRVHEVDRRGTGQSPIIVSWINGAT